MAIMCSMQACMAKAGMCSHEKMMLGVAVLVVAGAGAYYLFACSYPAKPQFQPRCQLLFANEMLGILPNNRRASPSSHLFIYTIGERIRLGSSVCPSSVTTVTHLCEEGLKSCSLPNRFLSI